MTGPKRKLSRRAVLKASSMLAAGAAFGRSGALCWPESETSKDGEVRSSGQSSRPAPMEEPFFSLPAHGFKSEVPAKNWQHGLLTGNGTLGAIVMGDPYDDTIYLSDSRIYLPLAKSPKYIEMAQRLPAIRELCLAGEFRSAGEQIIAARSQYSFLDQRDPFIGAFSLGIRVPKRGLLRMQRTVDFLTAEACISFEDDLGISKRAAFVSREHNVLVLRLDGTCPQSAAFSFSQMPWSQSSGSDGGADEKLIVEGIKASEHGVKKNCLYFRTLFANSNQFNLLKGYEGVGHIVSLGGQREESADAITILDAREILVIVKIAPILKNSNSETSFPLLCAELDRVAPDYEALLKAHVKKHRELISRVTFSLGASDAERSKPTERLNEDSLNIEAPLAKIERAFHAARYNIICSTGTNPPNLQGLWTATWAAPWHGDFTVNGNLPCAVSFNLMGNTAELMEPFFRFYEERAQDFRTCAKSLYGMRGLHVPCHMTTSGLETDFMPNYPHVFSHSAAPWAMQFYFDYYRYTGDLGFLRNRAYPMMKATCEFLEDFLTLTDERGKLIIVPSYSPENAPGGEDNCPTAINSTMDVSAAKQVLRNSAVAAKHLGCDEDLQAKWVDLAAKLPDYEVGPDGSFREWLWPGLKESNQHRHCSHLYALFDECPSEILDNSELVRAVEHTLRERMAFRAQDTFMAFGEVQIGLAAARIGSSELAQECINVLAKGYWSDGMASFHNWGDLFNMDISGGFPYLCASTLVYADPGRIKLFPALPKQWKRGSIEGIRLRGGILVKELKWEDRSAMVVLVSDATQAVTIEAWGKEWKKNLRPGIECGLNFEQA